MNTLPNPTNDEQSGITRFRDSSLAEDLLKNRTAERKQQGPHISGAALPSQVQTFETDLLAEDWNFAGLVGVNRELIGRAEALDSLHRTVLNMDSTEIPAYGEQEQNANNGNFESTYCCCSTVRVIVWRRSSGLVTFAT